AHYHTQEREGDHRSSRGKGSKEPAGARRQHAPPGEQQPRRPGDGNGHKQVSNRPAKTRTLWGGSQWGQGGGGGPRADQCPEGQSQARPVQDLLHRESSGLGRKRRGAPHDVAEGAIGGLDNGKDKAERSD